MLHRQVVPLPGSLSARVRPAPLLLPRTAFGGARGCSQTRGRNGFRGSPVGADDVISEHLGPFHSLGSLLCLKSRKANFTVKGGVVGCLL